MSMKRRELFRRTILGAAGSALTSALPGNAIEHEPAARQFPRDHDASKDLSRSDWKPVFLDAHQNETLIVLSDLIIPKTDTPGAREALVNRFIDRLLAAEGHETRRAFLASLTYVDGESMTRYGAAFVHLPAERQVELLKFIAYPHSLATWGDNRSEFGGHAHFLNLKKWISQAYYSSEMGMKELGWDDNVFHGDFEGCSHPQDSHK
jgi:Gluconate 2-dehydrogenase subunit 3